MDQIKIAMLLVSTLVSIAQPTCQQKRTQQDLHKIAFDYQSVDSTGMLGGVVVDYEFCIPDEQAYVDEIRSIVPDVIVSADSKGRIRCTEDQYLCIVSGSENHWKEKLYRIADLDYVTRIIRTYYE